MRGAGGFQPAEELSDSFQFSKPYRKRALGSFMVLVFNVIAVVLFTMYYKDTNSRSIITSYFQCSCDVFVLFIKIRGLLDIFPVLVCIEAKRAFEHMPTNE